MTKFWILTLIAITLFGCNDNKIEKEAEENPPKLTGKYLGQKEPSIKPEVFASNIVSTGMAEINAVFSPNLKEFYYSIRMPNGQLVIMVLKNDGAPLLPPVCNWRLSHSFFVLAQLHPIIIDLQSVKYFQLTTHANLFSPPFSPPVEVPFLY